MNKRKKLLLTYLKLFSLILFFLALKSLYFKALPQRIFTAYHPKIEYQKEMLSRVDQSFDTLIMGDSLATFNLKSTHISSSTLNLSLFGATFVEVYFSLKQYLAKNKTPQTIILLNGQNWEHKREYEFWPYYIGFGFFNLEDLLSIKYQEAHFPFLHSLKWFFYSSGIPNYDFSQLQSSLFHGNSIEKNNRFIADLLKRDNGSMVLQERFPKDRPVFQPYHQQYQSDFKVNATNDFYFKKLLDLISKNDIKLVMIEPPLMPLVKDKENFVSFRQQLRDYYLEKLNSYNFKYCQDTTTIYQDEDFYDLDHLLERGAKKFAAFVKTCL